MLAIVKICCFTSVSVSILNTLVRSKSSLARSSRKRSSVARYLNFLQKVRGEGTQRQDWASMAFTA